MQSRVRQAWVRCLPWAILALAFWPGVSAGEGAGPDAEAAPRETPSPQRPAMQNLLESAAPLLPIAMDEAAWSNPR